MSNEKIEELRKRVAQAELNITECERDRDEAALSSRASSAALNEAVSKLRAKVEELQPFQDARDVAERKATACSSAFTTSVRHLRDATNALCLVRAELDLELAQAQPATDAASEAHG